MTRIIEKPHPTLRAQAGALFSTDRLKRECQHYRVSDYGFEIDGVVLHFIVKGFVLRVREKLLQVDFELLLDLDEAANTFADRRHIDLCTDQNPVVERLESHIDMHRRAQRNADHGIAERLRNDNVQGFLPHLTGAVHQIEDGDRVRARRGRKVSGHHGIVLARGSALTMDSSRRDAI